MPRTPKKMNTFVLMENDVTVSPIFTTAREYGRWMKVTYDEFTCNYHLYDKLEGDTTAEYHPSSKLNKYLDSLTDVDSSLQSWYISQSSNIVTSIIRQHIAAIEDCDIVNHKRMLRIYPVDQITLYIKGNIDSNFNMINKLHPAVPIIINPIDHNFMDIPEHKPGITLLDDIINQHKKQVVFDSTKKVKLTLSQIEQELGYRIELIPEVP